MRQIFVGSVAALALITASFNTNSQAHAINYPTPPTGAFTCTHITFAHQGWTTDRDNTGSELENFTTLVTDGVGNEIYKRQIGITVGSSGSPYYKDIIFTEPPVANPLTLTVVSDAGNGLAEQEEVRLTGSCNGLPIGYPPKVSPAAFTVAAGVSFTGSLASYATDPGGGPVSFALATDPTHGTVAVNSDGTFEYTASNSASDPDQFTVSVIDGSGNNVDLIVTMTITNDLPPKPKSPTPPERIEASAI